MPEAIDYWMKYCVWKGISFDDCARGAQILSERDDDGNLSNEQYYMANGWDSLRAVLDAEKADPASSDHQTIDWEYRNTKRY